MTKLKLTDLRISSLGKEYAIILNDYCIEEENYTNWNSNDYKIFVDKFYDEFVLTAIDEGIIEQTDKKYFKSYDDEVHDKIKKVAIDELKVLIRER